MNQPRVASRVPLSIYGDNITRKERDVSLVGWGLCRSYWTRRRGGIDRWRPCTLSGISWRRALLHERFVGSFYCDISERYGVDFITDS